MRTPKKSQSLNSIIPTHIRFKLERSARQNGVTMSWLVRAIIQEYRATRRQMPRFRRPRRLTGDFSRFCLRLHGDKEELLLYARANGGEFSPFLRFLLDLWDRGLLSPDLESSKTTKTVKTIKLVKECATSDALFTQEIYKETDYWPKNPWNNIWLMDLGLNSQK